jgi:hypothetical protein
VKHVIEGKRGRGTEVRAKQGRRHKQLVDDVKKTRGYWKLKKKH